MKGQPGDSGARLPSMRGHTHSSAKGLPRLVRRGLWKALEQATTPARRQLLQQYQVLTQEMTDIQEELANLKGTLAALASQTSQRQGAIPTEDEARQSTRLVGLRSGDSLAFASQFRGSFQEIKARQQDYVVVGWRPVQQGEDP